MGTTSSWRRDPLDALPRVSIEIIRGRARDRLREMVGSAFLIGAAEDCDIVLVDNRFPDVHAYLIRRINGVSIRYLGAKPALTVNNRLVRSSPIEDGDCIRTGPFEFVVHVEPSRQPIGPGVRPVSRLSASRRSPVGSDVYAEALGEALQLLREIRRSALKPAPPIRHIAPPGRLTPASGVAS